jgi:hypothetical protein
MSQCDACTHKIIQVDKMGVYCDFQLPLFPKKNNCLEFDSNGQEVYIDRRIGVTEEAYLKIVELGLLDVR